MSNIDKLKKYLNTDLKDYKSIPFWSWNNKLSADKLVQQIEEMKSAGIGGFIIHARTGLKTEYLSDEWFYCVEKCLYKAKELNMNAWIYDENGWPSGFVGGKLLENEEYRARYLEYNVTSSFDETAYCVFIEDNDEFIRVSSNVSTNRYHNIYLRVSPANTDILNPKVVEKYPFQKVGG